MNELYIDKIRRIAEEEEKYLRYTEAMKLFQKDLELSERIATERGTLDDLKNLSVSYNNVARIYDKMGYRDQALQLYLKSMELYEKITAERDGLDDLWNLSACYNNVAEIYRSQKNFEETLQLYLKSMELLERIVAERGTPDEIRKLSLVNHEIGLVYEKMGQYEKALKQYQKERELYTKIDKECRTSDEFLGARKGRDDKEDAKLKISSGQQSPGCCFCRVCGARCRPIDVFCSHCGSRIRDLNSVQTMPMLEASPGLDSSCRVPLGSDERDDNTSSAYGDSVYAQPGYGYPAPSQFSFERETTALSHHTPLEISKVHFSAIAPRKLAKGEYAIIDIVMYENAYRSVVEKRIKDAEVVDGNAVQEIKSGVARVKAGARVKIKLTSPDIMIEDNVEEQEWVSEYLIFNFAVMIPKIYAKRQVLFTATVYIDDLIATRLMFITKCWSLRQQKIKVTQENVLSAFVSYASQDRNRVAMIVQGMKKARPDMDIFFDVESLRSGESWQDALWSEIDQRDTLFLCWSHYAAESPWVAREWKYCYEQKGAEAIEPIPLEPPSICPPPKELERKHFNDRLLYLIKAESEGSR